MIANKGEVWKEVGLLIHGHISMPFLGGFALSFLTIYPTAFLFGGGLFNQGYSIFDPILVTYLAFVLAASAITMMSNRRPAVIQSPAHQDATQATS